MQQWMEIRQIVKDVQFEEENDCIVWQYSSLGKYCSLYVIINNRG
jgi:putative lipoic acid-binding regulatory protein